MISGAKVLYISTLLLVFGVIAALPVWIILTWAQEPRGIVVQSNIIEAEIEAGGIAHLEGYVTIPRNCDVVVWRSAYDPSGTMIGTLNEFFVAGSEQRTIKTTRELSIPATATPGKAILYRNVQWSCNWPQRIFPRVRPISSADFIIKEPKQ